MGDTIDSKKVRLVNKITSVQNEALLDLLEKVFDANAAVDAAIWAKVIKPIRQRQTIDDMIREQNLKKFAGRGLIKLSKN